MADHSDLTLDEIRLLLAPAIADAAVFDGWGEAALTAAADEHGIDPAIAALAFSGGPMAIITAWIASIDAAMEREFTGNSLSNQPIRERIRRLVSFRLDMLAGREEALTRALSIMAMPHNAARALRLGWAGADAMWYLAGDKATDYNHYTKRTILAGIYAATLAVYAHDRSEGKTETQSFLTRRIDGVMRFEKAKARLLRPSDEHFSLTRLLGRLRYPAV
jgi:ubiquinone biosynthesis protein COQ9